LVGARTLRAGLAARTRSARMSASIERDMPTSNEHDASPTLSAEAGIGALLQRIIEDAETLAREELALAKLELIRTGERTAAGMAALTLGGVLALISLGLLCVTVVVALQPLIHALWLRMLIMSLAYFCIGSLLVGICMARLFKKPVTLPKTRKEAEKTVTAIKQELQHAR
jgi:hypothetical protein